MDNYSIELVIGFKISIEFMQVVFTITSEQMMLYDKDWYIPTTEYKVYVGGQQPDQQLKVPSNVLSGSFAVHPW